MKGLTQKLNVPFVIDNSSFERSDIVIKSISRSFSVVDGQNAGRDLTGSMLRDIIGTYYNYTVDFSSKNFNPEAYEFLVELLSSPVDYHMVSFPFGNKTITQKMYVANGQDVLKRFDPNGKNQFTDFSVNFVAMNPFLRPGGA